MRRCDRTWRMVQVRQHHLPRVQVLQCGSVYPVLSVSNFGLDCHGRAATGSTQGPKSVFLLDLAEHFAGGC